MKKKVDKKATKKKDKKKDKEAGKDVEFVPSWADVEEILYLDDDSNLN